MPKVETKNLTRGNNNQYIILNSTKNSVSKSIGKTSYANNEIAYKNIFKHHIKRTRRSLDKNEEKKSDQVNNPIKRRRKIKIIRRRPKYINITNQNHDNSYVINREVELLDNHRKRIIVTKKRKLNNITHSIIATNNRRRVVVTKKRLLKPISDSFSDKQEYTEPKETEKIEPTLTHSSEIFSTITDNFYYITPEPEVDTDKQTFEYLPDTTHYALESSEYSSEVYGHSPATSDYKQEIIDNEQKITNYYPETLYYLPDTTAYFSHSLEYESDIDEYDSETSEYFSDTLKYLPETSAYLPESEVLENLEKSEYLPTTPQYLSEVFPSLEIKNQLLEKINSSTANPSPSYTLTKNTNIPSYEIYTTLLSETVTTSFIKNKTYTYVVTRVHENEQLITSTTSVKAAVKTEVLTLTHTLTLTKPITFFDGPTLININAEGFEENGKYNIATRVMSNGVEVIVAGDKSTDLSFANEQDNPVEKSAFENLVKSKEALPRDVDSGENNMSSVHPNQFITKTLLTTYTYLTTYLQGGTTTVSSHERIITNTATEERNVGKIMPTPTVGITLTDNPNLAVGVFHTTYTYLNTIQDGKMHLTETTTHTVANTVTAPDDYLSLLQPSEPTSAVLDTNTYYSTVALTTTLTEGSSEKIISSTNTVTQVVITESTPPKGMSVMTSYIALDIEDLEPSAVASIATTDVVKTHYVTYTYYNTYLEHGETVVRTNVSTSTDIVTEKLYLHLKKTQTDTTTQKPIKTNAIENTTLQDKEVQVFATKTYLTTFTYFTTLLKSAPNDQTTTVINSHTRVVENVIVEPSTNKSFENKVSFTEKTNRLDTTSILVIDTKIKIKDISTQEKIEPTTSSKSSLTDFPSTSPSVITGSTIIFFDDESGALPVMEKLTKTLDETGKVSLRSRTSTNVPDTKSSLNINILTSSTLNNILPSKTTSDFIKSSLVQLKVNDVAISNTTTSNKPLTKPNKPEFQDLLGTFTALRPVINAMADIINNNLHNNNIRRNDTIYPDTSPKPRTPFLKENQSVLNESELKNRAPIYIPVGELADDKIEVAESQNFGQLIYNSNGIFSNKWTDHTESRHKNHIVIGKPTHESPLVNGGIPISPGEVITANSDVIVGRPSVMGPRIPLDTSSFTQYYESEIGMQPPPIPTESQTAALYKEQSYDKIKYGAKRDDYIGPPPAEPQFSFRRKPLQQNKYRDNPEKNAPNRERPYMHFGIRPYPFATNFRNVNRYNPNRPPIIPLHYDNNDNRNSATKHNYVISVNDDSSNRERLPFKDNFNVQKKNQLNSIPTPQTYEEGPLFKDPSPLPEPEFGSGFVGIKTYDSDVTLATTTFNNDNIHLANEPQNQSFESLKNGFYGNIQNTANSKYNQKAPYQPIYKSQPDVVDSRPVGVGHVSSYPSGHLIKHVVTEGIVLDAPLDNEPGSTIIHAHQPNIETTNENIPHIIPNNYNKLSNAPKVPIYNSNNIPVYARPEIINKPIFNYHDHSSEISQYMTPPPPRTILPMKLNIPVYIHPESPDMHRPQSNQGLEFYKDNIINGNYHVEEDGSIIDDSVIDQHKEDDIANEEGEVVQESNPRPLLPGQIPVEILKASNAQADLSRPTINTQTEAGYELLKEYTTQGYDILEHNLSVKKSTTNINPRPFSRPNNNFEIKKPYSPIISQSHIPVIVYPNRNIPHNKIGPVSGTQSVLLPKPNIVKTNVYHQNNKRIYGFGNKIPIINTGTYSTPQEYETKPNIPYINTKFAQNEITSKRPNFTQDVTIRPTDSLVDSSLKVLYKQYISNKTNELMSETTTSNIALTTFNYTHPLESMYDVGIELNTGEITSYKTENKYPDIDNQSDIFDGKESAHPHNHGSITSHVVSHNATLNDMHIGDLRPPLSSIIYSNNGLGNVIKTSNNILNQSSNKNAENNKITTQHMHIPLYVPKPSENMKPPPVSQNYSPIINEEVVGLSPPPPANILNPSIDLSSIIQPDESFKNTNYKISQLNGNNNSTNKTSSSYTFEIPNEDIIPESANDMIPNESNIHKNTETSTQFSTINYDITTIETETSKLSQEPTVNSIHETHENAIIPQTKLTQTNRNNEILFDSLDSGSESVTTFVPPQIKISQNTTKSVGKIVTNNDKTLADIADIIVSKTNDISVINTTPISKHEQTYINIRTTSKSSDTNSPNMNTQNLSEENYASSGYKETSLHNFKYIIPTRYITHTQTLTVTSTKTTVIKSQGSPPSTLTLVLTKTQTSTIVDTVTEIRTLVQPTSILKTITTTVKSKVIPTSLPNPHHPPITRPDIKKIIISADDENLKEFIIDDYKNDSKADDDTIDNDSILVVLTDHANHANPTDIHEINQIMNNPENTIKEANPVLLGGVLIDTPPHLQKNVNLKPDECRPECKSSFNESCQKFEGTMRCICRPGFVRMFPDRPCKPTYTYTVQLGVARNGKQKLKYTPALADSMTTAYASLASATHEGIHRMIMQSDLRDLYHGMRVTGFQNTSTGHGVMNTFFIQLSENTEEQYLKNVFKNYLRRSNYSLGGTEIYSAREYENNLVANDFDECLNSQFHDCSENAQCFNLKGTYTCSCKEGYADLSSNSLYPGRTCSAEQIGCEKCHYHGTCYNNEDQILCSCFQWYAGEYCHVNLKVLLIALVTLGAIFCALLLICIIITCFKKKQKPNNKNKSSGIGFLQQRSSSGNRLNVTLDKRAMIQDTSSEGSQSDTNTLPYVAKKGAKSKNSTTKKNENQMKKDLKNGSYDQQDRSLTVMIPRAKYHPHPTTSTFLNVEALDRRKSNASSNEAKLLSYLDIGVAVNQSVQSRKTSNQSAATKTVSQKPSIGALVSAGFEVSARVAGTEADRSENATLIHKIRKDFPTANDTSSQFNTIQKSHSHTDLIDPMSDWLDVTPRAIGELTVSEARSYDETTIQPLTKTMRSIYNSKPPSHHHNNDEANTMAERDLGSTFLLPHTHLYKPDRGSDISGFDSL